ncbi:hypothetical protein [Enterobacter sp.]|uniref:hypothetical protein n=1 Tax=Enterobacter sp. TaxID=42895 RepID=UPI00296F40DB|nr:hypothetical protein [Enterobacter sp.]
MHKLIVVFSFLLLTGCALQANYIPENSQLKDAEVGVPYYGQINILGGFVSAINRHGEEVLADKIITTEHTGLYVQQCNNSMGNNCIQIRGVPTKPGLVKVRVAGGLSGGMFSSGARFNKTYTIVIKELHVN